MKSGFILAGASSGAGKTTLTLGVMKALADKGLKIQGYKVGPDYIDPAFHFFATGSKSRNLDGWMLSDAALIHLFNKAATEAEVCVVEGVMGLFDGSASDPERGSSAHIARLTGLPVVLIVDGSGTFTSAAAVVKGFKEFDDRIRIGGVIVNRVSSPTHYDMIRHAVETHTGIPCMGYLKKNKELSLSSRHLGLVPAHEISGVQDKIALMAEEVQATVDLDALLGLSPITTEHSLSGKSPQEKQLSDFLSKNEGHFKGLKLAVAWDKAFNFYYEDNLRLLEELGAELVRFSPLEDPSLPDGVHGLYIGGGFPEMFPKELSENHEMMESIRRASQHGMPIYAECGGLMYLCTTLTDFSGTTYSMTKVLPLTTRMTEKLQRFGYVEVTLSQESLLGPEGTKFRAHEFHRSVTEPCTDFGEASQLSLETQKAERVYAITKKSMGADKTWQCGYISEAGNVLAAYAHLHFYAEPQTAISFLKNCQNWAETHGGDNGIK